MENRYITIPKLAEILGISRIAVYKKVKKGEIKAMKIGRNYVIHRKFVDNIFGKELNSQEKREIDTAVRKTVREYGEVLKLLGKE
ncbi:MAG: helix-turn-helix domain-containing protein [Elusimicrobia bacterium]|nr:helix-turn-helix domain-containing protein [Elusimicrobiota bacterium]